MAYSNVEINNTTSTGWISIYLNTLSNDESEHHFPISGLQGLCMKDLSGNLGIEMHIEHETSPLYLSFDASSPNFMQVDAVNGTAPTDLDDLKLLIMGLTI